MPPVRSRAACNGCRNRKQKCDEGKPVCARCQRLQRPCVWPVTLKRGPTKGYTEALEHRLEATENALLRLLSVTDQSLVEVALDTNNTIKGHLENSMATAANKNAISARTTEDKALLMSSWDEFPLANAEDLRKWAENTSQKARSTSPRTPIDMAIRQEYDQGASSQAAVQDLSPAASANVIQGLSRSTNTIQPYDISSSIKSCSHDPFVLEETITTSGFRAGLMEDAITVQEDRQSCDNAGIATRGNPRVSNISEQFRQQFLW